MDMEMERAEWNEFEKFIDYDDTYSWRHAQRSTIIHPSE